MQKSGLMNAFNARYPEPVALVVSFDRRLDRPNISAQGWFMFTSYVPPMLAISIANGHHTCATIRDSGEFVLALPSAEQADAVYLCGALSGREHDKFVKSGLKPLSAEKVKTPLIAGACANFECKVVSSLSTGDHTIFTGEIVQSHIAEDSRNRLFATSDGKFAGYKT